MKIQHLRYFAAVVDHGGVVRASERLHLTQPSVSAGLKALEQELGCALFERGGGRLRLTQAGGRFYRRAVDILRQCDAAKAEAMGLAGPARFCVGMAVTVSDAHRADFAARLLAAMGEPQPTFRSGPPVRLAQWLKQERIEAALTILEEADAPEDATLLLREPFVCLTHARHRFVGRTSLTLQDLAGEPFVTRPQCERHRAAEAIFRSSHVAVNVVHVSNADADALAFVRAGLGITLAPASLGADGLCRIPVAGLRLERALYLTWQAEVPRIWKDNITAAALAALSLQEGATTEHT
ncbi:LysR family transcriptional regulator [Aquabacter sp. L1I39]|uniref:LysR family transcriptional regulator n=1 Tax=Aquabacter sp. L1I39 TaxID=2820278 RepID=UPI001AD9BF20|nr:LysR family transcriptional regulator [Aquabacter sp. L1I39]QTL04663.1 LysR family transcriptional regulator [Aquabacter sp. L1I39]